MGNPKLKPQRIHTVEYQVSWKPSRFFGVTSGVSYNWLLDKAEFTPQGINLTARNVASQRTFSWETRADARHYEDYTAYGSFEWVYSLRDLGQEGYAATSWGSKNVVYPPWIARTGVNVSVPSPCSLPLTLGERKACWSRRGARTTRASSRAAASSTCRAISCSTSSLHARDLPDPRAGDSDLRCAGAICSALAGQIRAFRASSIRSCRARFPGALACVLAR